MTAMPTPQEAATSELEEHMRADLREAQRARDQVRMDTLRLALGAFHNEEVARTDATHKLHGQALTEADRLALVEKQIKQRHEAAEQFRLGKRPEQAAKEEREAAILSAYLPARLSDEEIREIVGGLVAAHGTEFRMVMPLASKATKGRADGRRVQEIVRELTGSA